MELKPVEEIPEWVWQGIKRIIDDNKTHSLVLPALVLPADSVIEIELLNRLSIGRDSLEALCFDEEFLERISYPMFLITRDYPNVKPNNDN